MLKRLRYFCEAIPVYLIYGLLRLLPHPWARDGLAGFCGWLGPLLPVSKTMRRNLVLSGLAETPETQQPLIRQSWQNLGRLAGSLPHSPRLSIGTEPSAEIQVHNAHFFKQLVEQQQPALYVTAHLGNWELLGHVAAHYGLPARRVYRKANNPYFDRLVQTNRERKGGFIPKGPQGGKALLQALKRGENIGILLDQKFNEGAVVPFFGRPAATPVAVYDLAKRFNRPLVPCYCVFHEGRYQLFIEEPYWLDEETTPEQAATFINQRYEAWIRQYPGQWLWQHKRWPKQEYLL